MRRALVAAALVPRVALTVVAGYLSVLTVAATTSRRADRERSGDASGEPTPRLVVLIPAHDEEQLIGTTLAALSRSDYPASRFGVRVVADNCTDATVDIARGHGVAVDDRRDPDDPGKGPALRWAIGRLVAAGDEPDAYVFIDADTTVEPDFLRRLADRLADGDAVVQGHYAVRDAESTPVVAFRAAALAARTYLRPLGRNRIGGSAGLYGNGMLFRADLMRSTGWSDHLTEDIELQLQLLVDSGTLVSFAPDARVEAEMPATLEASRTQHERWERGRVDLARRYLPTLLRHAITGGRARRVAYLDAALDQAVPPFSVVVAATASWSALAAARLPFDRRRARWIDAAWAATLAASFFAYVLTALRLVGAPRAVYRSLLGAPRMVLWKLALWARVLVGRQPARWVRTARNAPP